MTGNDRSGDGSAGDDRDRWRMTGDDAADTLARDLLTAFGAEGRDETDVLRRAVRAVAAGVGSTNDDVRKWFLDGPEIPEWAKDRQIAAGQRFFARWPMPIATALFCASLPTAYASRHGAAVLVATSRLSDRDHVKRRLAETGRLVFDVMDPTRTADAALVAGLPRPSRRRGRGPAVARPGVVDPAVVDPSVARPAVDPTGDDDRGRLLDGPGTAADVLPLHRGSQAYLSVRGVRLLHAVVRQALQSRPDEPWPEERGVPINQEDLLGTLMTFTVTVLDALDRLGVTVTPADADAYFHTWRVVGAQLGIDEAILPETLEDARVVAADLARRHLGPSADGRRLVGELVHQMRLAMPVGCRDLPATLIHQLVPDVARLLHLPRPGWGWSTAVDGVCTTIRLARRVPRVRERIAAGPGAVVGRSILQLFMDREEAIGYPAYRLDVGQVLAQVRRPGLRATARRVARGSRRDGEADRPGLDRPAPLELPTPLDLPVAPLDPLSEEALATLPDAVSLPISVDDVRRIASEGFTLTEDVARLLQRNRSITTGYADLSRQLAHLIAGGEARDANWCTFASWSSMTIGTLLDDLLPGAVLELVAGGPEGSSAPGVLLEGLVHRAMRREDGAAFRTLAAGNRAVFLEVGLSVATFVSHFGDVASTGDRVIHDREDAWAGYWAAVRRQLEAFTALDVSWMLTETPAPDDLHLGLRQYFEALTEPDPHLRSERVLAGNILLGAYEQRRVDGYVWAAMALFTDDAVQRLLCEGSGELDGPRRLPNRLFARLMTRRMQLRLPDGEMFEIGAPVRPPIDPADRWPALATDDGIRLPLLQALVAQYRLGTRHGRGRGCGDWTSFEQRMRTIGSLFRSRQRQHSMFDDPLAGQD